MANLKIDIGEVVDIENDYSTYIKDGKHDLDQPFGGLRVRVRLNSDRNGDKPLPPEKVPWSFPLLPKTFQSIPKRGEGAFVICDENANGQRYYLGPVISQPQYNTECAKDNGVSLLNFGNKDSKKPLEKVGEKTVGAFPNNDDVAVVGRGAEDVILKYDSSTKASEVDIRAGIRCEPTNDPNPNMIGNIIFNEADPAYIQLKYKKGLCSLPEANSMINIVADRINLISNKDNNVAHNIHDKNNLIQDEKISDITYNLQPIPLGHQLIDYLITLQMVVLHHVHPWAGMEQCGDWGGFTQKLLNYDLSKLLSQYVRIS